MEEFLSKRVKKLIIDCDELISTTSNIQGKDMYREIKERYQIISDILEDPECEMNEALFYGIIDLISVNREQREEIEFIEGRVLDWEEK